MQKFAVGDVTRYIGPATGTWTGEHIIHEPQHLGGGDFEYSTTQGAWIPQGDLELVRKADDKSFAQLDAVVAEEGM